MKAILTAAIHWLIDDSYKYFNSASSVEIKMTSLMSAVLSCGLGYTLLSSLVNIIIGNFQFLLTIAHFVGEGVTMENILFLLIVVITSLMPARTRSEGKIPFFKLLLLS